MTIKQYLINLLPFNWLAHDSYKDSVGDGFVKRLVGAIGTTFDTEIIPKVDSARQLQNPELAGESHLTLLSQSLGIYESMTLSVESNRRMLAQITTIARIRGTVQSYKDLIYFLGFSNVEITEEAPTQLIYDAELLYDTGLRRDSGFSNDRVGYTIELTGSLTFTLEIFAKLQNIRRYLEPINAKFIEYLYNGEPLADLAVTISIVDGDLFYDNEADPSLVLTLSPTGDLIIDGPNADKYYISEGNLFFKVNEL